MYIFDLFIVAGCSLQINLGSVRIHTGQLKLLIFVIQLFQEI